MGDFDGFRWKETVAVVGAFVAVAGFLTVIWVDESRALRKRVRNLEIIQTQLWCAVNPETCMGDRNAP